MPSESVHIRQAEHNKQFLDWLDLDVTEYLDWAVTVIFYTALHFVEWLLASKGLHSDSYANRHQAMGRVSELKRIWPDYRELELQSYRSRYQGAQFAGDFVKGELIPKLERIDSTFAVARKDAKTRFSLERRKPPPFPASFEWLG